MKKGSLELIALVVGLLVLIVTAILMFSGVFNKVSSFYYTNIAIAIAFLVYIGYSWTTINNLNQEIRQLQNHVKSLKSDIQKLKGELDTTKSELSKTQSQLEISEKEKAEIRGEHQLAQDEIMKLKKQLSEKKPPENT